MNLKPGDKVTYIKDGKQQKGVVKHTIKTDDCCPENVVRVVYHCNEDWDNYANYTGLSTNINSLKLGWDEIHN